MASYGYIIIMIIVDSCMIWFNFDCVMLLKKSYHVATNVCSKRSATTFGDLPDCSYSHKRAYYSSVASAERTKELLSINCRIGQTLL